MLMTLSRYASWWWRRSFFPQKNYETKVFSLAKVFIVEKLKFVHSPRTFRMSSSLIFQKETKTSEIKLTHNLRNSMSGMREGGRKAHNLWEKKLCFLLFFHFFSASFCWRRGYLITSNLFGIGRRRRKIKRENGEEDFCGSTARRGEEFKAVCCF